MPPTEGINGSLRTRRACCLDQWNNGRLTPKVANPANPRSTPRSSRLPSPVRTFPCKTPPPMFARLSQLSRHLSRPLPNYTHRSAAVSGFSLAGSIMTSLSAAAEERSRCTIHTAAALIIGDEILNGKVCSCCLPAPCNWHCLNHSRLWTPTQRILPSSVSSSGSTSSESRSFRMTRARSSRQ